MVDPPWCFTWSHAEWCYIKLLYTVRGVNMYIDVCESWSLKWYPDRPQRNWLSYSQENPDGLGCSKREKDRSEDQNTGRSVHQNTDRSVDQTTDRSVDQNTGRSVDQNTGRSVHQNTDRSVHQNTDRSVDQNTDRSVDQNTDRSVDKNTDAKGTILDAPNKFRVDSIIYTLKKETYRNKSKPTYSIWSD